MRSRCNQTAARVASLRLQEHVHSGMRSAAEPDAGVAVVCNPTNNAGVDGGHHQPNTLETTLVCGDQDRPASVERLDAEATAYIVSTGNRETEGGACMDIDQSRRSMQQQATDASASSSPSGNVTRETARASATATSTGTATARAEDRPSKEEVEFSSV